MTYQRVGPWPLDEEPVRYPGCELAFRGPRRELAPGFVACLGGTETHGRGIAKPWPDQLEAGLGTACANFGQPNAGPDVFLAGGGPMCLVEGAGAAVLQVPPAMNLSNGYYRVHPRRNDRFLCAQAPLRALYPEVDFTEFHFTRHLMQRLEGTSHDRFARLIDAVQRAWVARMTELIDRIPAPVILLWMGRTAPGDGTGTAGIADDPAFVSRAMLDAIAPRAAAMVCTLTPAETAACPPPDVAAPIEMGYVAGLPGSRAHEDVARAVRPALAACLKC